MIERGRGGAGQGAGPQAAPLRGEAAQRESEEKKRGFSLSSLLAYLITAEGRAPVQRQCPYQLGFVWGGIAAPGREAFRRRGAGLQVCSRARMCAHIHGHRVSANAGLCAFVSAHVCISLYHCVSPHSSHPCVTWCVWVGSKQSCSVRGGGATSGGPGGAGPRSPYFPVGTRGWDGYVRSQVTHGHGRGRREGHHTTWSCDPGDVYREERTCGRGGQTR